MENLETKTEKLDWKQWLPLFGIYYDIYKISKGKRNRQFSFGETLYHGVVSGFIIGLPFGYVLSKIFE